jgi:hypothetical protein
MRSKRRAMTTLGTFISTVLHQPIVCGAPLLPWAVKHLGRPLLLAVQATKN